MIDGIPDRTDTQHIDDALHGVVGVFHMPRDGDGAFLGGVHKIGVTVPLHGYVLRRPVLEFHRSVAAQRSTAIVIIEVIADFFPERYFYAHRIDRGDFRNRYRRCDGDGGITAILLLQLAVDLERARLLHLVGSHRIPMDIDRNLGAIGQMHVDALRQFGEHADPRGDIDRVDRLEFRHRDLRLDGGFLNAHGTVPRPRSRAFDLERARLLHLVGSHGIPNNGRPYGSTIRQCALIAGRQLRCHAHGSRDIDHLRRDKRSRDGGRFTSHRRCRRCCCSRLGLRCGRLRCPGKDQRRGRLLVGALHGAFECVRSRCKVLQILGVMVSVAGPCDIDLFR